MSDTPKFEVIDRRKLKKEGEQESGSSQSSAAASPEPEHAPSGPRLVETDSAKPPQSETAVQASEEEALPGEMPPPPSPEEMREQESAYEASAQRVEDLLRAQNPTMGAQPPIRFEHLIQQLYVSALMQMGAATPEGQRPRVDIIGARQSIDLLGVLEEKSRGNLTPSEAQMLETVLFELRMTFLELSKMISLQGVQAPPPKPEKH